ncbi:MAG TPA: energy transducer TonB [Telluria sp.]|jgi:protein TonB
MKTFIRTSSVVIVLLAGLCGCSTVGTVASGVTSAVGDVASLVARPFSSRAKPAPVPAGLDDYKTRVARQVVDRNPDHIYTGKLPDMLPAIVVLAITVDSQGRLTGLEVQRARDSHAAQVALASMRRSEPLPAPQSLAQAGSLKFSETFLFADEDRFQLRSLVGP